MVGLGLFGLCRQSKHRLPFSAVRKACLEGQVDLVSRLITPIIHIVTLIIPIITYLLSPPDPPSEVGTIVEKMTRSVGNGPAYQRTRRHDTLGNPKPYKSS